ncbi:hypothetical protein X801_01943, partial [Opisthorchis viverrini]|uniref:Uncharacterized protein n=2 Tax=Opisthorchis viverrini TaxID=6198 RepID=A0A075A393_OPIVI
MSAVVSITVNFEEKRPIAMGVVTCGTGVGCACLSTLMPMVISRMGWKHSMYILATIAFTTVIYSVLLRSKARQASIRPSLNLPVIMPQMMTLDSNLAEAPKMPSQIMSSTFAFYSTWDVEQAKKHMYLTSFLGNIGSFVYLEGLDNFLKSRSKANKEPLHLLKNFQFIILFLASFFFAFTFMTPIVYLFDRLRQNGISDANISLILSAYGVFGAIARLSMGIISSFSWCKKHIFLFFWIIISSVSNIASNYMTTTWDFALFSCTLATAQGAFIVLQPLVLAEIVLPEDLTDALGLMLLASGAGYLMGTPMMALVFDCWKKYEACYLTCGVILAFTALLTTTIVIAYIRQVLMEKYERRLKMRLANEMSNWIRRESSSSQE